MIVYDTIKIYDLGWNGTVHSGKTANRWTAIIALSISARSFGARASDAPQSDR